MTSPTISLLDRAGLAREDARRHLARGLEGADDGELYLEYAQSEMLVFDNGRLKQATYNTDQGFGLRAVKDEAVGYAHSSDLSEDALARAADAVRAVKGGYGGRYAEPPGRTNVRLYGDDNPLGEPAFDSKVKLLQTIDAYVRGKEARVRQVSVSLGASWQVVEILRPDGETYRDVRPLVRLNVSVIIEHQGRREQGYAGGGGRFAYTEFLASGRWKALVQEAVRTAQVNLEAVPAPAGTMTVVLGAGWPGVLLHEAVGHGLEGDFNRKGTSAFANRIGERVATEACTVVDDGTIAQRRGSLNIDDEGTATQCTVLIENGILRGYMQDKLNARLMGGASTGNGRRESFAHVTLPRMTNTYMRPGPYEPDEIIRSRVGHLVPGRCANAYRASPASSKAARMSAASA